MAIGESPALEERGGTSLLCLLLSSTDPLYNKLTIDDIVFVIAEPQPDSTIPPSMSKAIFNQLGNSIDLKFSGPTNTPSLSATNTDCKWLLAASVTTTLGTGAKCKWTSNDNMKISLGRGATIKPGDNIMLWEGQRVKSRFANFRASPIAAPCQVFPVVILVQPIIG